jgi:hypothetical protein
MARITVNTTGTQPTLLVSTDLISNSANWGNIANSLAVTCLQDITVTNSTGIFSWTDFCSLDINKITTPADNEISTNIVIDDIGFFGNANATANSATFYGVAGLSTNKVEVQWKLVLNGNNTSNGAYYYAGQGYISSVAPTVSPESPVWVSPMSIAVDGAMTTGKNP